jgi:Concanavalin A-like lectin/glucanases superfamily
MHESPSLTASPRRLAAWTSLLFLTTSCSLLWSADDLSGGPGPGDASAGGSGGAAAGGGAAGGGGTSASGGTAGAAGTGASGGAAGTGASGGAAGTGASGGAAGAGASGGAAGSGGASGAGGACSPPVTTGLLFHSTLDSLVAVQNPLVGKGTGAKVVPTNGFIDAICAKGIQLDAPGETLGIPEAVGGIANITYTKGTISFWFLPAFSANDGKRHDLIWSSGLSSQGGLNLFKSSADELVMEACKPGIGCKNTTIGKGDFTFTASSVNPLWTHLTVTWNFVQVTGQNVRIYQDDKELKYAPNPSSGTFGLPAPSDSQFIQLGGNLAPFDGVADELRIWDSEVPP